MASVFGAPARCQWRPGAAKAPFTWVLLDDEFRELARHEGLAATELPLPPEVRELFESGQSYHWYVIGEGPTGPLAGVHETVEIR
ncbi:MAG: hypothetical protein ACK501_09775 [Planctomycetota bacterium]